MNDQENQAHNLQPGERSPLTPDGGPDALPPTSPFFTANHETIGNSFGSHSSEAAYGHSGHARLPGSNETYPSSGQYHLGAGANRSNSFASSAPFTSIPGAFSNTNEHAPSGYATATESFSSPFASSEASPFGYQPHPSFPPKPTKRMWSTATLVFAILFGLIMGGTVGGIAGANLNRGLNPYSAPSYDPDNFDNTPTVPRWDGSNHGQSQNIEGIDSGTKVDKAPGVVLINSERFNGQGAGTGIVVDSSGIVVTNYHVVEGSSTVTVTTADSAQSYEASVVGHNASRDVAVLQLKNPPSNLETVTLANTKVKRGDTVYAQGNGSGQGYITELEGSVTALNRNIIASDSANREDSNRLTGLIETDADVVSGYSGGPLMNDKHEVVGINTAASTGKTSEEVNGYAIPIDDVMSVVQQIRNNDTNNGNIIGPNAALGITVTTVNNESGQSGVQVQDVLEGSGAQAAGIQKGDIILALDGQRARSASDLSKTVRSKAIGDKVTLTIIGAADGTQKEVEVTLGKSSVN